MSAFPEFDLSALLGDTDDLRHDNLVDGLNDAGQSSPITTPPPPVNLEPTSNNSTPSKSRKRPRKNASYSDDMGAMASLIATVDSVASDFQIATDVEVSTNSNNNGDFSNIKEPSPSPNQLVVADEYLNTEEGNHEGEESGNHLNSPPASPDGITNEDSGLAKCETCDITFLTKRQRSEHLRDVHGVEKPFKCEHCRARFPYSSSLYNHSRIHSESRPFKCNLCDSSFRWKNSLRHHRLYIHKEEPSTVQIAPKCVWEGKKPPPPDMPLPAPGVAPAPSGPTDAASAAPPPAKKPREKKPRSSAKRSSNANGTTHPPFEIDVAKLLEEAEKAFANSYTTDNASGTSGAISTSFSSTTATPTAVAPKRKRKPKATFRRNDLGEVTSSGGAQGQGHTCGHCEKEFSVWSDLVSHIKDCAEKEKATLSDGAGASWMAADEAQEGQRNKMSHEQENFADSDGDSEAPGGLVIDPMDGGIRQDSFEEEEEIIDASANYNSDSMGGISREVHMEDLGDEHSENHSEMGYDATNADLEYRIGELEKRLGEVSHSYEARIEALESTVSRLRAQLAKDDDV